MSHKRQNLSSVPHSVLNYIITRAMIQGKTGATEIMLPLDQMIQETEGAKYYPDASDLVLKVTITTEWVAGNQADVVVEMDDESEEGEEHGSGESSGTDKKGH